MNCATCQELLQLRLDGAEPRDLAEMLLHVQRCSDCRDMQAAAACLHASLRLLRPPAPPADLAHSITGQLLADYHRRQRLRRWSAVAASVAALLLVSIGLLRWGWSPRTGDSTASDRLVQDKGEDKSRPEQPEQRPAEVMTLRESVSEVSSAVASAATKTADAARSDLLPLVPMTSLPSLQMTATLDPPTRSLREAGQGVSGGLAPVADSARRAVDLFLRELPPMDVPDKAGL